MFRLIRQPVLATARLNLRGLATQAQAPPPASATFTKPNPNETITKFWTHVGLEQTETQYALQLDSKPLKTPLGNPLSVPTSRGVLAHLIQHEWSSLSGAIKTHSLPLTSLASRAIDLEFANETKDPEAITKVGKREDIIEMLLRYLDTDTVLVFSPEAEYEGTLRKAQEDLYRPVIANIEKFFNTSLTYLDSDRDGLRGNRQSDETKEKARAWMSQLSYWDLVALEKTTLTTKSLICGIILLLSKTPRGVSYPELNLKLEEIAHMASLEIVYQTDRWGEVEDTHDVDYQDLRRNVNSAALLCFEERV